MPTVIINKFNGGHAESRYSTIFGVCEESQNFDLLVDEESLTPHRDLVTESVTSGTIADHKLSDIVGGIVVSGNNHTYVGLGQVGTSDTNLKFFSKNTVTDNWTKIVEDTSGSVINGTLVTYKGLAYALKTQSPNIQLLELTNSSTITSRGTVSSESSACKPYIHPEDNILYGGCGDTLWSWNGTTFNSYTAIMPTGSIITSLTSYGTYLVVAIRQLNGNGVAYLWGRDGTLTTTQGIINFGRGDLNIIENIGDTIVGIVTKSSDVLDYKLKLKTWSGGAVQTIREVPATAFSSGSTLKAFMNDRLYFILGAVECVYMVSKNNNGELVISKDRWIDGGLVPSSVYGLSVLDDYLFVGFIDSSTANQFLRTTSSYIDPSIYTTTVNPNMDIGDKYKDKSLVGVQVSYTGKSTGTTKVRYSDNKYLTGIGNPSGSTTVTGTDTLFTEEVIVGDKILMEDNTRREIRTVTAVGSATSLTVDVAFTFNASQPMKRFRLVISDTMATSDYEEKTLEATMENAGIPLLSGREYQFMLESTGGNIIKDFRYKYDVINSPI